MAEWGRDVATRFFAGYKSDGNFMLLRFADGMEARSPPKCRCINAVEAGSKRKSVSRSARPTPGRWPDFLGQT